MEYMAICIGFALPSGVAGEAASGRQNVTTMMGSARRCAGRITCFSTIPAFPSSMVVEAKSHPVTLTPLTMTSICPFELAAVAEGVNLAVNFMFDPTLPPGIITEALLSFVQVNSLSGKPHPFP
jgi:hypothetical protein